MPNETKDLLKMYLETLTPKEYAAYEFSKNLLGDTFSLEKSNGFIQWKLKQEVKQL